MEIPKISQNKHLGMASVLLGIVIYFTAPDILTLAGGLFLFAAGLVLWWINK